jgi:hypothetical protein
VIVDKARQGRAISRKTIHERGSENIKIIGPAIVHYIPDHLHILLSGSLQHGRKGREIEPTRPLDHRPARAVTNGANIKASQQLVIAEYLAIMLGELQQVQSDPRPVNMAGRFKACQKKGIE